MNHVKKMILVPHESVARLHDTPTSTPQTQMNTLDTEMSHIMRKQYADDSEKWKKYNEALQRYLHFANESRKPFAFELGSVAEKTDDSPIRQQLTSVMPKTFKNQALRIFDYLSQAGSPVTWDSAGAVSIRGTSIPLSNIIDLVSDLTRSRKKFEPLGIKPFVDAIAHMNIPLDLIGNEKHRTAILDSKQVGGGIALPVENTQNKNKPVSKPLKKIPRKKKSLGIKNGWKKW